MSAEINASSVAAIVSPEVTAAQIVTLSDGQRVAKGQLIIFGAKTLSRDSLALLIANYKGIIIGQNPEAYLYQVQFPTDTAESALLEIKKALGNNSNIVTAGLNSISSTAAIDPNPIYPADPVWTARPPGSNSDDTAWNMKVINAPDAWGQAYALGRDISIVRVGVVDGGFSQRADRDVHFESIIGPSGDNVDILSKDAEKGMSNNNHGMHVSGIIAATGNNNLGVTGVAWKNIELLAARTDYSDFSIYAQITRLLNKGAKVINYSAGQSAALPIETLDSRFNSDRIEFSNFMDKMLERYDFLFIGSAGNSGDINARYNGHGSASLSDYITQNDANSLSKLKASVNLPNVRAHILSVGAIAPTYSSLGDSISLETANYSQFGVSVEIAAPGGNYCGSALPRWDRQFSEYGGLKPDSETCTTRAIWSTYYERELNIDAGTSMAAPHVTGAAALMWQVNPKLSAQQVKEILLQTAGGANGHTVKKKDGNSQSLPVLNLKMAIQKAIDTNSNGISTPSSSVVPLVGQLVCGTSAINEKPNVKVELLQEIKIAGVAFAPKLISTTTTSLLGIFILNASPGDIVPIKYFLRFTDSLGITQTKLFTVSSSTGPIAPINISPNCGQLASIDIESGIQGLDSGSNLLIGQINSAGSSGTQEAYPLRVNLIVNAQGLIVSADYDFHRTAGTTDACVFTSGVNETTCFGRSGNYSTTDQSAPNGAWAIGVNGSAEPVVLTMTDSWGVAWTGTITGLEWVGTWDATGPGVNPQIGPDVGKTGTFKVQVAVTVN